MSSMYSSFFSIILQVYGLNLRNQIRMLEKTNLKLVRCIQAVHFLKYCKKHNLSPKFMTMKMSFYSTQSNRIMKLAGSKLLNERIRYSYSKKFELMKDVRKLNYEVKVSVQAIHWEMLCATMN